ncbi:TolB family protein [Thalassotalea euphylliae]|uniref:TolB family protein n=1 Tax=Thalassotalea euphylliae TaxID=1655234 RepID=UPI003629B568
MKLFLKTIASLAIGLATANAVAAQLPYYSEEANNKAVEFGKGIISTERFEINAVFNEAGDNVLFARCADDFSTCQMMSSDYENGQWQMPTALPFSGGYLEADPYYSADYSTLYFVSKRPIDGSLTATESVNLWKTKMVDGQWQEPEYMPELSSDANDLYPSVTNNDDLYFPSFRNEKRLMYVAKATANGFEKPQALPAEMFGEGGLIGDTVVLRDGKTIIYSMRRADSLGKGDLYVSKLVDGKWTVATTLGDKVNTADHEFTPIVSPDGQYLFFTRIENGRGNIYQIALSALGL